MPKIYDRTYFDRWYRQENLGIGSRQALMRKARLAISTAEYYLGRPIHNVLDIGCGEGVWQPVLKAERPKISYLGLDSSEYVVERFGRTRNIRLATFGQLGELRFDEGFDLIVCSDVLHYVRTPELKRGLRGIAEQLQGVAFLELFTADDALAGDTDGFIARSPRWYLSTFREAGLISCGSHCYLGPHLTAAVATLEVPMLW
ncbi:class I SAM-dependent methyltransferase [Pseudolysobacter antarcticus]|uniref:Class I SAM-dependent methyltransferase n=1 Tax=Pseudolysobacter antarcticus TaxID=2511995 RepID=A0A411HP03_9GAMM|nr:class I SAM-dependent methyltransferase [Pseudolysobacter antarcticus]QBB72150.1 class I SAM-dependent methyltransferase [Pseudolysobacter antarcticus]